MNIKNDILLGLNKLLKIEFVGYEQDWFLEFADPARISEFIEILKSNDLSPPQKYAIVSLIIASYDDYLNLERDNNAKIWNEILSVLNDNPKLYHEILDYWAFWKTDIVGGKFKITPLIREYLQTRS